MARRYDLLAIDLDGTLLDHHGRVPEANVHALARARRDGLAVTICTGRALIECRAILAQIEQVDPVIVSGGAMVACPRSGETLERFAMEAALIERVVSFLHERGHPALILKDPAAAGFDYLAVHPGGPAALDPASRWWFEHMGVRVRYAARLEDDEHPEHSVRVGAYAANRPVDDLAVALREAFGAWAMMQHFSGVLLPPERREQGVLSVHIVELFHPNADKWLALERLAGRLGVGASRVAAVGDQLNDLSMITHAGLGIAMGNAHERVKAAAKAQTLDAASGGVAHAIDRIIEGAW